MGLGFVGGGGGSRLCTVGPPGTCLVAVLLGDGATGGILRGLG